MSTRWCHISSQPKYLTGWNWKALAARGNGSVSVSIGLGHPERSSASFKKAQAKREPALSKRAKRARRMGISRGAIRVTPEIPPPAGENAGVREDSYKKEIQAGKTSA